MRLRILAKSDIGKAREMNQDSFFVSRLNDDIQIFILMSIILLFIMMLFNLMKCVYYLIFQLYLWQQDQILELLFNIKRIKKI